MRLTGRLERLERDLQEADRLLLQVDNSLLFRLARMPGRFLRDWRGRLGQALLHSPFHPLYLKLAPPAADDAYAAWAARTVAVPPHISHRPFISVLMPVHDPPREWLQAAVDSVLAQSYPHWELCICDDASRDPWVREYLAARCASDRRVRFVRSDESRGISGATNLAGALAAGDYIGFLDQDDLLAPGALAWVAAALQDEADLVYTDEDRLDADGRRVAPIFKPGWSPDLLLSCMYMGHFLVARRAAVERAGWLRGAFDGSQDYDLALRIADQGGAVRHVPHVLYHWRGHAGSTASRAGAKSYTQRAGREALREALARRGIAAAVGDAPVPNAYRVRRKASGAPASIVICSRKAGLLARCLRGIERRTAYREREIVVVEHLAGKQARLERVASQYGCTRVPYTGPFDFASMNNLGAAHARGGVLVFLNDDVTPLDPGWLEALVAQAERAEVGAVGARLLYPSGAIQHAGLAVGIMNGVGHPQRDTFGAGCWPWWNLTRNVAAVTGACLAIRKAVFAELGGFDTRFPVNYNDADLCLRARAAGYEVIYEAAAVLRHDECRTRRPGVGWAERASWGRRWGGWIDSYYSPHLTLASEDASLRAPNAL